jgi:hypothetical protein
MYHNSILSLTLYDVLFHQIKSFNYCLLLNPSSSQVHIIFFHKIFVLSLAICQMQSLPCLASFMMIGPYVEMYFNYFHEYAIFKSFHNTPSLSSGINDK